VDQVCTAAANLHISGRVAHLDMKADNLLIGPGGAAGDIGVTPCDLGTTATEATLARMQRGGRCAVSCCVMSWCLLPPGNACMVEQSRGGGYDSKRHPGSFSVTPAFAGMSGDTCLHRNHILHGQRCQIKT
jgi:hypothetical protein